MKILTLPAILLFSTMATAAPKVGDQVVYNDSVTERDGTRTLSTTKLSIVGQEPDGSFNVTSVLTTNGQTSQESRIWKAEESPSEEWGAYIVANCAQYSGALQELTVAAGKFQTCMIKTASADTSWFGQVPFALVKRVILDEGDVLTMELASVVRGP
jgi:hypothetical protein